MLKFVAALSVVALSAPLGAAQISFDAPAAPATQANAPTSTLKGDPNRMVCERQDEIGSRLGGKKVCKTALEWDIERRQNRDTIESVQRQATSTGIPSGSI